MSLKNIVSLPEYKSTLPSGLVVKYRPFVVKEEKILLMAKESKDMEQIYSCIKNVIKNCIIEPQNLDIDKMSYFDVQQLFIYLRCKSMGESVQIRVTDPQTKQSFETELDLEKIKIENVNTKPKKVKLSEALAVEFKYPTFSDFIKLTNNNAISNSTESIDLILCISALCVNKVFTKDETIDCSDLSQQEIVEFINSLPKKEFEKFVEFFVKMPKLSYKSEFKNPTTGKVFPVEVMDFTNFFIL
jgi:hypothetical protein